MSAMYFWAFVLKDYLEYYWRFKWKKLMRKVW